MLSCYADMKSAYNVFSLLNPMLSVSSGFVVIAIRGESAISEYTTCTVQLQSVMLECTRVFSTLSLSCTSA